MVKLALTGVFVPSVICGVLLLLSQCWARRTGGEERFAHWSSAFLCGALGLAYLVTHGLLVGWPELPWLDLPPASLDAKHWVFYSISLGVLLGVPVEALSGRPRLFGRWLLRVVVLGVLLTGTLYSQVKWSWEIEKSVAMFVGLSLGGLFHYFSWDLLWTRRPGAGPPFLFLLLGSGCSLTLLIAGSASLAQLLGALSAGVGAVCLLSLVAGQGGLREGASTILGTGIMGLILNGHLFIPLPGMDSLLLILACHLPLLLFLPVLRDRYSKVAFVLVTILLVVLVGFVVSQARDRQQLELQKEAEMRRAYEGELFGEEGAWEGF